MRIAVFPVALFVSSSLLAQGSAMLDSVEILDPTLTASVRFSSGSGDCQGPPGSLVNLPCEPSVGFEYEHFPAADGSLYVWNRTLSPSCGGGTDERYSLVRIGLDKSVGEVLGLNITKCLTCSAGCTQILQGSYGGQPDPVNGLLYVHGRSDLYDCIPGVGCQLASTGHGLVVISGFPALFDTLMTYIPGGQTLSLLMPKHPDGFRAADSLQVWTGDVRSMPDWSQAQPLTCEAATTPAPGQVVTVADALPDPAVGHGRYYITASQSGPDRRLGRQYVNGAFSARSPEALPVCQ